MAAVVASALVAALVGVAAVVVVAAAAGLVVAVTAQVLQAFYPCCSPSLSLSPFLYHNKYKYICYINSLLTAVNYYISYRRNNPMKAA